MSEDEKDISIMYYIVSNYTYSNEVVVNAAGDPPTMYYGLNPAEKILAEAHPFQATQYYVSSQVALNSTQQKFGYSGYQDSSDAFRHACWNGVLTMRIGLTAAKEWTDAHEAYSTGIDKQMDLFNNQIGRMLGSPWYGYADTSYGTGYATTQIVDNVYSYVKSGQCRIIENGNLVPSY